MCTCEEGDVHHVCTCEEGDVHRVCTCEEGDVHHVCTCCCIEQQYVRIPIPADTQHKAESISILS